MASQVPNRAKEKVKKALGVKLRKYVINRESDKIVHPNQLVQTRPYKSLVSKPMVLGKNDIFIRSSIYQQENQGLTTFDNKHEEVRAFLKKNPIPKEFLK